MCVCKCIYVFVSWREWICFTYHFNVDSMKEELSSGDLDFTQSAGQILFFTSAERIINVNSVSGEKCAFVIYHPTICLA